MSALVTLSAQASAVETLIKAARGGVKLTAVEREFVQDRAAAAVRTLRWLEKNEAAIRRAVEQARAAS